MKIVRTRVDHTCFLCDTQLTAGYKYFMAYSGQSTFISHEYYCINCSLIMLKDLILQIEKLEWDE